MSKLVIDLDGTITLGDVSNYEEVSPNIKVIEQLKKYKKEGFTITIFTSRNMRTYNGNIKLIETHTLPGIIRWLKKHKVPYDEIIIGKPWCKENGFYIDDRAIRPSEFISKNKHEIKALLAKEKEIECFS